MAFSLRTSFIGNLYYRVLRKHLLPWLEKAGATPIQLTLSGVVVAVLVPFGFYLHPAVGLVIMLASGLADSLDGLMARQRNQVSTYGAFLDSSLDRLSDLFFLMGFWILFWDEKGFLGATILFFLCLLSTSMISYVKARAEALGTACDIGILERGVRVLYLAVWALALCLLPGEREWILWTGLGLYTTLTFLTVLQRILHVKKALSDPADTGPQKG